MKITLPITFLAVVASAGAADLHDEVRRWCSSRGQACDTVRRAAEALVETLESTRSIPVRDESSSETALIARRQVDELALAVAASQSDPDAFWNRIYIGQWPPYYPPPPPVAANDTTSAAGPEKRAANPQWCGHFSGHTCWKRDWIPEAADADAKTGWCARSAGQPCWEHREEKADEVEKRSPEADPQWCGRFRGKLCWKRDVAPERRAADPQWCSRFRGTTCWKRDGGAAAAEEHRRCTSEGHACWRAKRAAEAVLDAINAGNALTAKREADPQWCGGVRGSACWKRAASAEAACYAPSGACTKATRDLHAMYNAARSIVDAN